MRSGCDGQRMPDELPVRGEELEVFFLGLHEEQLVEGISVGKRGLQLAGGVTLGQGHNEPALLIREPPLGLHQTIQEWSIEEDAHQAVSRLFLVLKSQNAAAEGGVVKGG